MDEETKGHLDAMEARMMGRINTNHEQLLDRFRGVDATLAVTTEAIRAVNGTLSSLTVLMNMLVTSHGDHGRRITDLEKKP